MSARGVAILALGEAEGALVSAIDQDPELTVVRRCADLPEIQAAIRSGVADIAVVDIQDPDADASTIAALKQARAIVIVLAPLAQASTVRTWGAHGVAQPSAPSSVVESIRAALAQAESQGHDVAPVSLPPIPEDTAEPHQDQPTGRIIAVWGTSGAPGRSTVALTLAGEMGQPALLLDADTAHPCVATMLAITQDTVGVGALARLAHRGELLPTDIDRAAIPITRTLRVVVGISSGQRYREVSLLSLQKILDTARLCSPVTVVDCASATLDPLEDTQRRPTTRDEQVGTVLRAADHIVLVARGDVLGMERLEHSLTWLKELELDTPVSVVVNRVSKLTAGPRPTNAVTSSLVGMIGGQTAWIVPEDPAVTSALLHGTTVARRKTGASAILRELAGELTAVVQTSAR